MKTKTLLTTLIILCSVYSFGQRVQIKFKTEQAVQVVNDEYELFWGYDEVFTIYLNDKQYEGEMTIATLTRRYLIELDESSDVQYYIVEEVADGLLWTFRARQVLQRPNEKFYL